MREIIVFENMTLDGFMAGPKGEIDWAIQDNEVTTLARQGQGPVATFLFGRVTYDMMSSFWPTPAAEAANPTFAGILNSSPKVAFSRTLKSAGWKGTRLLDNLNKDAILALKGESGGNIMIFGSASVVKQIAALGLVDEYQLLVNPVVLGAGLRLFDDSAGKANLQLADSRTFKSGIVFLRYRPEAR